MIFPSASLKRSPRIQARKNSTSADTVIVYPSSLSSVLSRRKTRPPPLQIIPELSENVLDIRATHSPATARPVQFIPQQPSRITLSAYTFSIDDALLMFAGDAPRSPALSASSTSDGTSSEDVPTTPRTSDDEVGYDFMLHTPRLYPQRVSIRPLCVIKTRCPEDEEIHNYFDQEEQKVVLTVTEGMSENLTTAKIAMEVTEEADQDFYAREFEDFVSFFPAIPSPTSPARRDSFILVNESFPAVVEVPEPKPRGRSRHSKPLPLLPPATPPASTFPLITGFPSVQTVTEKSVRRKRDIQSPPNGSPPLTPAIPRPLPRMAVPVNIEDCVFTEENLNIPLCGPVFNERAYDMQEDAGIYSQPSITHMVSASIRPHPPAIPGTSHSGMCGEITLPRSSTDSDAPRSSTDSTSSFTSSASSNTPFPPFSFPSSPSSEERLRSRWSSSTLGSLAVEPPRAATLFSPLRGVFGTRTRRVPPPQKTPPHLTTSKAAKNKHNITTTPSPPSTSNKHIRRQGSRSSMSSAGTVSSECDSHDGSPSRRKRKPIPIAMFLRTA